MSDEAPHIIYRARDRLVPILFGVLFIPMTLVIGAYGAHTESWFKAAAVFFSMSGFTWLMLFLLLRMFADTEIDDVGLRKKYFGHVIQSIDWANVDRLMMRMQWDQEAFRPKCVFTVVARKGRPNGSAWLISIPERSDNIELVKALKSQVAKHEIRVIDLIPKRES